MAKRSKVRARRKATTLAQGTSDKKVAKASRPVPRARAAKAAKPAQPSPPARRPASSTAARGKRPSSAKPTRSTTSSRAGMSPEANRPPTAPTLENVAWQKHAKSTRRPNPASPPTCNALDIRRGLLLIINLAACGEQEAPQRTRGGDSTKDEQTLAERFCDGTLSVSEAVAFDDRAMKGHPPS